MKIIICGSTLFRNYTYLCRKMDMLTANLQKVLVLSAYEEGADLLGDQWGFHRGHNVVNYQHDPKKTRYLDMVQRADALVAFWNGTSTGTLKMIDLAEDHIPLARIRVFEYLGGDRE